VDQHEVLEKLKSKSPLVTLAILDCCRESAEVRAGYGGGEGLTGLAGPVGSLVMYATGEGGYAKDGLDGSEHGVFTDALLKVMDRPGLNLVEMCQTVKEEVKTLTGGEQVPDFKTGGDAMDEIPRLQKISLVAKAEAAAEPAPAPAGMAVRPGMEKWDSNGDGYLDEAELQAMTASAGLGAPPAGASPRPAAAIKTLADFVAACDDVDSMDELLADYSSREDFSGLLEA